MKYNAGKYFFIFFLASIIFDFKRIEFQSWRFQLLHLSGIISDTGEKKHVVSVSHVVARDAEVVHNRVEFARGRFSGFVCHPGKQT